MNRTPIVWSALLLAGSLLLSRPLRADDPPPEAPPTAPAPPAAPVAPRSGPPGPGGMVYVDAGEGQDVRVGTAPIEILKLVGARKDVLAQFGYETPVHKVELRPFFIDATEVSNAQYLKFLDLSAKTIYKTGTSALSNLFEIGSFHVFGDAKKAEEKQDDRTWAQLYELNKGLLEASMPELKGQKAKWKFATLPQDLELVVYRRWLPEHWFASSGVLDGDAGPDMPVRYVSYLDAAEFASWAGKHVPTEEEWEWAARGPEMRIYPWGNDWTEGIERGRRIVEKRVNWEDLKIENAAHEPTSLPVEDLPEGRSWCGCYHMLGNVAEWTSSWFKPYPGWSDTGGGKYVAYHDDYVRVIRGASCADRERLVLRLAARNFIGNGRMAPPVPENRFKYVGFRCASYLQPGLDRLEPTIMKLLRPQKIKTEQLVPQQFAGSMAVHHVATGQPAENHVFVTGGSAAVLFTPMSSLSARLPADERPRGHTPKEIVDAAKEEEPVVLGVLHTDVGIEKAKVAVPRKEEPKSTILRKRHQELPVPPTVEGKIAADSFIFGLWHEQIGLFTANLTFVGFVAVPTLERKVLKKDEAPPPSSISVEADADLVKCQFWIPVGGKNTPPEEGITFKFSFSTEAGALDKAGSWR